MKITIESTTRTIWLNNVECRIWEGTTESGIPIHCYIPSVAVRNGLPTEQFERELKERRPPSAEIAALPLRLIL